VPARSRPFASRAVPRARSARDVIEATELSADKLSVARNVICRIRLPAFESARPAAAVPLKTSVGSEGPRQPETRPDRPIQRLDRQAKRLQMWSTVSALNEVGAAKSRDAECRRLLRLRLPRFPALGENPRIKTRGGR